MRATAGPYDSSNFISAHLFFRKNPKVGNDTYMTSVLHDVLLNGDEQQPGVDVRIQIVNFKIGMKKQRYLKLVPCFFLYYISNVPISGISGRPNDAIRSTRLRFGPLGHLYFWVLSISRKDIVEVEFRNDPSDFGKLAPTPV
jgi:hypothetical protein